MGELKRLLMLPIAQAWQGSKVSERAAAGGRNAIYPGLRVCIDLSADPFVARLQI